MLVLNGRLYFFRMSLLGVRVTTLAYFIEDLVVVPFFA
jgi:hypothetical protein